MKQRCIIPSLIFWFTPFNSVFVQFLNDSFCMLFCLDIGGRRCIDLYLCPPVERFGVLEFDKGAEIDAIGYEHAKAEVDAWKVNHWSVLHFFSLSDIFLTVDPLMLQTKIIGSNDRLARVLFNGGSVNRAVKRTRSFAL